MTSPVAETKAVVHPDSSQVQDGTQSPDWGRHRSQNLSLSGYCFPERDWRLDVYPFKRPSSHSHDAIYLGFPSTLLCLLFLGSSALCLQVETSCFLHRRTKYEAFDGRFSGERCFDTIKLSFSLCKKSRSRMTWCKAMSVMTKAHLQDCAVANQSRGTLHARRFCIRPQPGELECSSHWAPPHHAEPLPLVMAIRSSCS